jgi:RNA polymerase sigma-70 factor (ECF subfamily)
MSPLADGDLVRQAQRGDRDAFAELFTRYEGRIFGYVYRMVGDRAWAEDLTQEAFIRAHQHLGRLGPPYDFKSWLYRIAGNLALDGLRRHRREVPLADWDSGAPELVDTRSAVDPEQQVRQAERRAAVWRTLHRLPDTYRQALLLRELEGLSYQEMAAVMGVSLDNVRVILHRARLAFRDLYGLQVMAEEGRLACDALNELLSAEVDGELDRATRRKVQKHIAACPICQRTRKELLTVSSLLAALAPVFPPPTLRPGFLARLRHLPPSGPPPPPAPPPGPVSRPGRGRWVALAAVGGVVLLVLGAMLALLLLSGLRTLSLSLASPTLPPVASPVASPPATPTGEAAVAPVEATPTPTARPPGETPSPTPTPTPCIPDARWVADVTVPDNTEFAPGTPFVKTWRVRNAGACAWEPGTKLVFISGDPMGGPPAVDVPALAPGAEAEVSVSMTAPAAPGTYRANYQFQAPDGTRFGAIIYAQIVVPATPTPTFTPTPSPTSPPTPSPTVVPPVGGCAVPVDPVFQPALDRFRSLYPTADIGCPTRAAFSVQGAVQEFWANVTDPNPNTHYRSLMIWRSDNREITVIDGEDTAASRGTFGAYTDTWDEGQPEIYPKCAQMTPPAGYQLPIRGFGKVWCVNGLWRPIGWPNQRELGNTLLVQPTETGMLMQVPASGVTYLVVLDYRGMWAVSVLK